MGAHDAPDPPAKRQKLAKGTTGKLQNGSSKSPGVPQGKSLATRRAKLDRERQQLPAWSAKDKVVELVRQHPTLVIIGETGSGKTTQLPRFLFEAGLARGGAVAVTQPRRVAALTVARRVAEEMGVQLGQTVGYSIRFDDCTSSATRIKYMTDGMLLREALLDPLLNKYKIVVLDEAHERTIHTDVLFGLLKGVQRRRGSDFKLVVMSATLDAAKFVDYFQGAQAAYIQGRQHPVEIHYTPEPEASYVDAALVAALQLHCEEPPGDVLVFLTGQDEIEALERLLRDRAQALPPGSSPYELQVVSIFAAMSPDKQLQVFKEAPEGTRKVILATNIAETSVTIRGVRYVIDTGFVKTRAYSPRLGADSLQVMPVSQAQARQRSGRAGREAPGKAFRLYTEDAFSQLPAVTPPEIQRANLATVVLQLLALGVKDVLGFEFMDPPPRAAVLRALELLLALGAIAKDGSLTHPLGSSMARLPVEPMFAKVLLASGPLGCVADAMAATAMMSTDNVFFTPRDGQQAAAASRRHFVSGEGDHVTYVRVYREFVGLPAKDRRQWCTEYHINHRSMLKAVDIHRQLERHLEALGLPTSSTGGSDTAPLRRALVSGLFPHAARRNTDGTYTVIATGQPVAIHPSSVLSGKQPGCVVFNEVVRTTRSYARQLCTLDPAWLPELAPAFFAQR